MKKLLPIVFSMLSVVNVTAQESTSKRFFDDPFNHPMASLYVVVAFVFIVLILVILVAVVMVRSLNTLVAVMEKERAQARGMKYSPKPSWWKTLMQKLNASVPVTQEKAIELDHDYDGIRELDNHLPPWWKWLFYVTIIWGVVYFFVYHVSHTLPLSNEEYEKEVALAEETISKYRAAQPQAEIDVATLQYTADPAMIENGKKVFMDNNCGSCHRNDGGGNTIGPNLTDAYWLHGGSVQEVFATVNDGVVEKGMPAWGRSLSPVKVRDVVFFIVSLQGSNPVDAKAPQGEIYQPIDVKADTVKAQASR